MKSSRFFRFDTSAILLILANILIIVLAVIQKWDIRDVLWIYWAQSLSIGIFNFLHILDLKNSSIKGYDDLHLPTKMNTKSWMASFFIFHYGLFHFIFLGFLIFIWQVLPQMSAFLFALGILSFLVTHGFAYWQSRQKATDRESNIGDIMLYPYARIMPMWLTLTVGIYYGKSSLSTLVLFLTLKTIADVIMHVLDPINARVTAIKNDRPPTLRDEGTEKPLEVNQTNLRRQSRFAAGGIFLLSMLGVEEPYTRRKRIVYLIIILIPVILIIYFLCSLPEGGIPNP